MDGLLQLGTAGMAVDDANDGNYQFNEKNNKMKEISFYDYLIGFSRWGVWGATGRAAIEINLQWNENGLRMIVVADGVKFYFIASWSNEMVRGKFTLIEVTAWIGKRFQGIVQNIAENNIPETTESIALISPHQFPTESQKQNSCVH